MRVRVLGGGWYGCHIAAELIAAGVPGVHLFDSAPRLFNGASGSNPARLHIGPHYPRSSATRAACLEHYAAFMAEYGGLTRAVPLNVYAIAAADSLVDFGTYRDVLRPQIEFLTVHDPAELGLRNVEGAILTGERHILIDATRAHFETVLAGRYTVDSTPELEAARGPWNWEIDCTFCARDEIGIDRFEPCVTVLLEGPADRAVTIMDGPFPSVYPWDESRGLSSLTSAGLTPLGRCKTHAAAAAVLAELAPGYVEERARAMLEQMAYFWPGVLDDYRVFTCLLSVRAMPRSAAAARLVEVARLGERFMRIRAGKIDAIFHAADAVKAAIC